VLVTEDGRRPPFYVGMKIVYFYIHFVCATCWL